MVLDTSGLLCLLHRAEPFHKQACEYYRTAHLRLTHNYVVAEFVALATVRRLLQWAALSFMVDLLNNPDIETIWVDKALNNEAMSLLLARPDKTYSLCDAVSFLLIMTPHNRTVRIFVSSPFSDLKAERNALRKSNGALRRQASQLEALRIKLRACPKTPCRGKLKTV